MLRNSTQSGQTYENEAGVEIPVIFRVSCDLLLRHLLKYYATRKKCVCATAILHMNSLTVQREYPTAEPRRHRRFEGDLTQRSLPHLRGGCG